MPIIPSRPVPPDWKEPAYKDIVRDVFRFRESLPLPLVNYPGVYGTWILFQEAAGTQPHLCACARGACVGFLRLNEQHQTYRLGPPQSLIDHFLWGDTASANRFRAATIMEFESSAIFVDGLCHLCNRRVPSVRWSNLGEHSAFLQHFGWYASMAMYAAGVDTIGDLVPSMVDPELQAFIEVDPVSTRRLLNDYRMRYGLGYGVFERATGFFDDARPGMADMRRLQNALTRQTKSMSRCIEARLRSKLGFPLHGKTGVSESILFWIVEALFKPAEVSRRVRLPFLGRLEVDLYVPSAHLAIEYQGEQHYEPFEHLGGLRSFKQVLKRDSEKAALCKTNGIYLEHFTVADKLTEEFVATRLSRYLPASGPAEKT